jgi:penicillin-binding protein 1C
MKKRKISKYLIILTVIIVLLFSLNLIFPPKIEKSFSKVITAKDGSLLTAYLSKDDKWRMKTKLNEVSPELIKAIINKEDKWFYWHPGVNPVAVIRALFSNIIRGERVSGASTITMQVVRLLNPKERTYSNKFVEMLRAMQLEVHYSKKEILEMYLSLLPFGGNIEGVKAASYFYFNRPPSKLSLAQAVTLMVIPNDPNDLRLDLNADRAIKKRDFWIGKFKEEKLFPISNLNDALNETLNSNRYERKFLAPHFCDYINANYKGEEIKTTLDPGIQQKAEVLLYNHINRAKTKNITNGALLIIDNSSSSVVGYCGSADYYDYNSSGQVNGVISIRSPGSTLKPALYAYAFNKGILTPKMKLLDIPTDFGGYNPENYDLKFHGDVTAESALMNSLNVPAVRLLQEVGFNEFLKFLGRGGFKEIEAQKNVLGLSTILGGCGVTLEELTRFYACFAGGGRVHHLNYLYGRKNNPGTSVLSEGSVYLVADILSNNYRPDFPNDLLDLTRLPKIAWKTGTSYGKRDAWAVGFNPRYTIGVWIGNFNGKGSPYLSGSEMAVPLLFDLFNSIDTGPEKNWFRKPGTVLTREVCAETGLLPAKNCPHLVHDHYIANCSLNKYCDLYKEVYVNISGTIEYCPGCLPKKGYIKEYYPFYDPQLKLWYMQNNVAFNKVPPHNPECQIKFGGKGPIITSPSKDYEYFIEENSGQEILLQAACGSGVKEIYWYLDDKYFKKSIPGKNLFFKPQKAKIKITCLDDKGRDANVIIKVKFY